MTDTENKRARLDFALKFSFMPEWRRRMPRRFRVPGVRGQVDGIAAIMMDEIEKGTMDEHSLRDRIEARLRSESRERRFGSIWLSLGLMVLQYILPLLLEWWKNRGMEEVGE
tara:strand:- start:2676 stop:3011 length:336 start_codon:yes stop_codon:yes gene_type:complete